MKAHHAIVINMSGGVFQGASSTLPIDVYVVDYEEPDEWSHVVQIEGSRAGLAQSSADVDERYVRKVALAPTVNITL